ncbi:hypothetical protein CMQ_5787 [Grosmannia clavigera kw1407]|uniref:Uncharacterized protein n=1 Tax=Grosmannia clavigera (strain kw1407 / UAMH 11150) TaxID=655863 RepID=F0XSG2_GROCL|nr:uncharacterized protein CMQ_5787 [Grosmannia clavigera kw1407]EFW99366.1 hypothetical protein CMQ_5787 [Grosmannia clavigera kw1407]
MSEPHSYPAPSFRGRGRGRGRSQAVRAHVARLAQQRKAANGRRGRQKLYDHPKPQAASERLKELKAAFSAVASALRPALEDLGDRSLGRLKSSSNAFQEVHEFKDVQQFLDGRHRQELTAYNNRLELSNRLNNYIYLESRTMTMANFVRDCNDATDRFLDAQIRRLDLLEQLHDLDLPVNIVDATWNFSEVSDERFLDVKAHVEYRTDLGTHPVYGNKVEVPCAKVMTGWRVRITSPSDAASDGAYKPSPKRRADDDADVQPPAKRLAGTADEGTSSLAPRHIGGLLSAVLPPTEDDAEEEAEAEADAEASGTLEGDSKVPSPSPVLAEGEEEMMEEDEAEDVPAGDEDGVGMAARPTEVKKLPPLPTGVTEPDAFGVRLVNKRRTANLDVYNRIMVPSLFDFEPHEIGFRDSANDKSRGATKAKRGKYLDTPNSNTMHFDRSLWQFDATTYDDGDLDEEMIKKHSLHPRYGLFLRSSTNEEEPPRERKSGSRPIVFYTPGGRTLNASRSNRIARLEDEADASAKKTVLFGAFSKFLEHEGVGDSEVQPPAEVVEAFRQQVLKRWLGPCRPRDDTEEEGKEKEEKSATGADAGVDADAEESHEGQSDVDGQQKQQQQQQQQQQDERDAAAASAFLGTLLEAAVAVETDRDSVPSLATALHSAYPICGPSTPPVPAPRRSTSSRPFDPVRDVFMDRSPDEDRRRNSSDNTISMSAANSRLNAADVSGLLYFASLASDREYMPSYSYPQSMRHVPRAPPLMQHQPQCQYPSYQQSTLSGESATPAEYAPRRPSIEHSPSYHHHHQQQPQQQQHHQLPLSRRNSHHNPENPPLDPRLFGETGGAPLPPTDASVHSLAINGYGSNGYHHQPSRSFLHTALNQAIPVSHHPYGPAPQANNAYGPPPPSTHRHSLPSPHMQSLSAMDMPSAYYLSPPAPTAQPQPIQQQQQQLHQPQQQQQQSQQASQHTLPMLRQYSNGYGPPRMQVAHSHNMSPQMYSAHMNGAQPPHQQQQQRPGQSRHSGRHTPVASLPVPATLPSAARGGTPPPGAGGSGEQGGGGGGGSSNSNGKYRKLEPAPVATRRSGWASSGDGVGGGGGSSSNGSSSNSSIGGVSTIGPLGIAATPISIATANRELRTVPYDYEKIKDYAAVEPPPSHGPKAIRGWAHNNVKRSRNGTKQEMASEWEKEEK